MGYLLTALGAYLMGCSNMALYVAKRKNIDLRSGGSGNLGTSNVVTMIGWGAGFLVALHDVGKAMLAVFLAELCFPALPEIGAVAGTACVLGHIFPFYLKFKGGKGFASYIGMTLMLNWKLALAVIVLVLLITVITDYLVLGTTVAVLAVPAYLGFAAGSVLPVLILGVATVVILVKHRANYVRMYHGREIGLRSAVKGEHRA